MRPIDADAFIAELREALDEEVKRIQPRVRANWMRGVHNTIEVLFKTLDKTPSVGWISVSERLPEPIPGGQKEYLVAIRHVLPEYKARDVVIAWYDTREEDCSLWRWYPAFGDGTYISHWMPLPEVEE